MQRQTFAQYVQSSGLPGFRVIINPDDPTRAVVSDGTSHIGGISPKRAWIKGTRDTVKRFNQAVLALHECYLNHEN